MEIRATVVPEPESSISVIAQEFFADSSSYSTLMVASQEALAGSSFSSHLDTQGDRFLVSSSMDGSSLPLPPEAEDQSIAPSTSHMSVSSWNSLPKTLDDYTLVLSVHNPMESFCRKTIVDDALSYVTAETLDNQPRSPLAPPKSTLDGSSLPLSAPAEDDCSNMFYSSDREAQEGGLGQYSSSLLNNNMSVYPSLLWSSPWSPRRSSPTSGSSLASKEWPSWSLSSLRSFPEERDSVLASESFLSLEDLGATLTNTFSAARIVPSIVGAGLENLGSTCFVNAILQCLTHTVPLILGLRSYDHSSPCDSDGTGFCVLCTLREHIELSLTTSGRILSPRKFVDNLNFFSSCFQRNQQEDAHEFMQCFLEKLERCFLDSMAKDVSKDDNLVKQIFGGRLISKLQCCNCGHCSDTYEPLIDLSLEIENVDNLTSALESFTKVEKIDAKFRCDSCKEEVSVEKQLMLDQTPSIATFHLKRFKTNGTYVQKINKRVDFPLELDLQPYTTCNQNNNVALQYELYAIVEHVGFSSTHGHYFCFICSSPDTWYRLDDSKVSRTFGDFLLSEGAYLLFYARKGTPWLGSIMEAQRPCLDPSILSTSPKSVLDNVDIMYNSHPEGENVKSRDFGEFKGIVEGVLDSSLGRHEGEGLGITEIIDSYHSPQPLTSELMVVDAGCNGYIADTIMISRQVPPGNRGYLDENSGINVRNGILASVEENNHHREIIDMEENDGFPASTPPSSPASNVFSPDMSYRIPNDHSKTDSQEGCKRSSNKSRKDSEREVLGYIKSIPGSRGVKLESAVLELLSDGILNKRRKIVDSSL